MPKAKKKTAAKRSVTCGKCNETGHNARTCPTKAEVKTAVSPPPVPRKTKVEPERRQSKVPKRDAPTADNSGSQAAPYRCKKCESVKILVIVRVKDYDESFKQKKEIFKGETRCENCMNKPTPAELILKWGARPGEVVPVPGQDDA